MAFGAVAETVRGWCCEKDTWFDVFSLLVKLDGLFNGVGVGVLFKVMRGRMKSEAWVV